MSGEGRRDGLSHEWVPRQTFRRAGLLIHCVLESGFVILYLIFYFYPVYLNYSFSRASGSSTSKALDWKTEEVCCAAWLQMELCGG